MGFPGIRIFFRRWTPTRICVTMACSDRMKTLCSRFLIDPCELVSQRNHHVRNSLVLVEELADFLDRRPPIRGTCIPKLARMLLRAGMLPRPYQHRVLSVSYRRSGFIVAPCASGKTLMGLMIAFANGGHESHQAVTSGFVRQSSGSRHSVRQRLLPFLT